MVGAGVSLSPNLCGLLNASSSWGACAPLLGETLRACTTVTMKLSQIQCLHGQIRCLHSHIHPFCLQLIYMELKYVLWRTVGRTFKCEDKLAPIEEDISISASNILCFVLASRDATYVSSLVQIAGQAGSFVMSSRDRYCLAIYDFFLATSMFEPYVK